MAEKEVLFYDVIDADRTMETDIATAVAQHADTSQTFIISVKGQVIVIGVG